jgi:hypothetical protein
MQAMLMRILSTLKAKPQKHIMFGNFFQLQILLIQRKADPRMLVACFARKVSVVAALPEPLHIFWRVLSWVKAKQEYNHVLQSTRRMMTGVEL